MGHLIHFRASSEFLESLRGTARARGIPVSRLIRDAVLRDIAGTSGARVAR